MEGEGPAGSRTPPGMSMLEKRKLQVAERRRAQQNAKKNEERVSASTIEKWKYGRFASVPSPKGKATENDAEVDFELVPPLSETTFENGAMKLAFWVPPLTRHLTCVGKRMNDARIRWKFTVALVGSRSVHHKSCLVHRFFFDEVDEDARNDYDGETKNVYINGEVVQMVVMSYHKRAKPDAYLFLYDITSPRSLEHIIHERELINASTNTPDKPCVLAGLNAYVSDPKRHAEDYQGPHVSSERAISLARQWKCCFYELDCLDEKSPVDVVFYQALNATLQRQTQQRASYRGCCLYCSTATLA